MGHPSRKLVVYEKEFGWSALWDLNPKSVGFALADSLCDLDGKLLKLTLNHTLAFALQPKTQGKPVMAAGQLDHVLSSQGQPRLAY